MSVAPATLTDHCAELGILHFPQPRQQLVEAKPREESRQLKEIRRPEFTPTEGLFRERRALSSFGWWGEVRDLLGLNDKQFPAPRKLHSLISAQSAVVSQPAFRKAPDELAALVARTKRMAQLVSSSKREHVSRGSYLHSYDVPVPNLPPQLEGFSVLHLSDLHFHRHRLDRVKEVRALANFLHQREYGVDMVACTGDVITDNSQDLNGLALKALSRVAPDAIRVFTAGNHDYYEGSYRYVRSAMESIGYRDLNGTGMRILVDGAPLNLFGIDDFLEGDPVVPDIDAKRRDETNLLLTHNLDAVRGNCPDVFDIILSGHLHAGEINLGFLNGVDIMRWFGYAQNINQHVCGWDALTNRALSYISPGHVRHWLHLNVERRGAALMRLTRSATET